VISSPLLSTLVASNLFDVISRVFRLTSLIRRIGHTSTSNVTLSTRKWQVPKRLIAYQHLRKSRNRKDTHEDVNVYQSDRSGFICGLTSLSEALQLKLPSFLRRNSGVEGLEEQTSCFPSPTHPHTSCLAADLASRSRFKTRILSVLDGLLFLLQMTFCFKTGTVRDLGPDPGPPRNARYACHPAADSPGDHLATWQCRASECGRVEVASVEGEGVLIYSDDQLVNFYGSWGGQV
jgi:hypothetical protein